MRATLTNRDFWTTGTTVTINIDNIETEDVEFLVNFLNGERPIERIRSLVTLRPPEPAKVVEKLSEVEVQDKRQKIRLRDEKKYESVPIGSIESLEL